jgi:hypothetical protein
MSTREDDIKNKDLDELENKESDETKEYDSEEERDEYKYPECNCPRIKNCDICYRDYCEKTQNDNCPHNIPKHMR